MFCEERGPLTLFWSFVIKKKKKDAISVSSCYLVNSEIMEIGNDAKNAIYNNIDTNRNNESSF